MRPSISYQLILVRGGIKSLVNGVGIRAIPPLVRLGVSIDIVELKAPTNLQPLIIIATNGNIGG